MSYPFMEGGVTAAKGYKASGIHCGIRKNRSKRDLALIVSDRLPAPPPFIHKIWSRGRR